MISEIGGNRTVYPIHSFDPAGTCVYDLLGVEQKFVQPNIEISFRTFRFATDNNQPQRQAIRCQLHLDLDASVSTSPTPKQCSCFTPCECGDLPGYVFDTALSSCTDINECDRVGHYCATHTHNCVNTPGSYECIPICPNGQNAHYWYTNKPGWIKRMTATYHHHLVLDDMDTSEFVYVHTDKFPRGFVPSITTINHDNPVIIGLQSSAYSGPTDPKWEIVIGGESPSAAVGTMHEIRYNSNGSPGGTFSVVQVFGDPRFGQLASRHPNLIFYSDGRGTFSSNS